MTDEPESDEAPPPRRAARVAQTLAIVSALLGLYAFGIEPRWIEVSEHGVDLGGLEEVTILHLSDLHIVGVGWREERVLELVRELAPDLIVITGDSILHESDRDAVTSVLSHLEAPLGVWACPGNHEVWYGPEAFACYEAAGVRMLRHGAAPLLDGRLMLLSIGDLDAAVPAERGPTTIALCHYPAVLPRVAAAGGVDVLFAGHTHGGQVRFPFVGPLWLPFGSGSYEQGWFGEGDTLMFVSRGVGTSILPVRFLCRPELALHRVRLRK